MKRRLSEWTGRIPCGVRGDPPRAPLTRALGPATLVLYDVSTLYFETDQGDGFREPGFSKERRLEPQITIGLLTDQPGSRLWQWRRSRETRPRPPPWSRPEEFMTAHRLTDITVVAGAGCARGNKKAIEAAGLGFILGKNRIAHIPYAIHRMA